MPQFTLDAFTGGITHQNKTGCVDGVCRFGLAVHLLKSTTESHDAILHGLDRRVSKLSFGFEPFEPTINSWTGILLIFG